MTDTKPTETPAYDPAAKTRVIVAGILLPVAWILALSFVVVTLMILPPAAAATWAYLIVIGGLLFALAATYAVVNGILHGQLITFD